MTDTGPAVKAEGGADTPRRYVLLSWAAVAVGIAFYLIHYFGHRSLWLDEAMLGLNIKYLSLGELAGKLEYDQMAPVGWLFLERLSLMLTGDLGYGLRLVSLISSVLGLVLFRQLAFRILLPFGALAAVILLAVNIAVVRYAVEAKPYVLAVGLGISLVYMGLSIIEKARPGLWRYALFTALGLLTVSVTFSTVYVLAAVGLTVFLKLVLDKRLAAAAATAAIGAVWLGAFAYLYLAVYQPQLGGNQLVEGGSNAFFNRTSYAPLPTSPAHIAWYARWFEKFFDFLFHREGWFPAALLIALGAFAFLRRRWPLALMALGPLAIGMVASHFKVYPLFERLTLFAVPGLILCAGAGAAQLARLSKGAVIAPAAVVAMVVFAAAPYDIGNLFKMHPPFAQHEVAPVLAALQKSYRPGDTVYVSNSTIPAWLTYREKYGLQNAPWRAGTSPEVSWPCMVADFPSSVNTGRLWVFFVSNQSEDQPVQAEVYPLLAERGLQANFHLIKSAPQAWLYQTDFSALPDGATPPVPHETCERDKLNNRFDVPERLGEIVGHPPL